jgi:hypothetical protein
MQSGDGSYRSRRHRWVVAAFVAFAAVFIAMKCMCPDPADAFRQSIAGDVQGAPIRGTPAPSPAPEPQEVKPAPVAAQITTQAQAQAPSPAAAPEKTTYVTKTWDDLSKFRYVPPTPDTGVSAAGVEKPAATPIPEEILALSGSQVAIEGYCVPLDYEKGIVKKFILIQAPLACCFAEAPPMNHWMMVTNDRGFEFDVAKYDAIRVSGVFDAGEETRDGYVVGIYRMRAEKIENVAR